MDAFERLHNSIQRALWDLKWEKLRDLQVKAINSWFTSEKDLLLMANTASGKTEAAFLPVLSTIAERNEAGSVRALYISPLKALINDQFRRLDDLCRHAEICVHRWHGDVSSAAKMKLLKTPSGVLLITPESLEALLMRRSRELEKVFSRLEAVVIDEVHAFLGTERGNQVSCQLTRLNEFPRGTRPRRAGLSATIGDVGHAREWLADGDLNRTEVVDSSFSRDVELLLKTCLSAPTIPSREDAGCRGATQLEEDGTEDSGCLALASHIAENFSGQSNLVFFNRKADIEATADLLRRICERSGRPNQFLVHHASLSKALREHAEEDLKSSRPCTVLCSSTLELGIDVGAVEAVGQVGPPHSVSSIKQRLGRSGRKETSPSRMYIYLPLVKGKPGDSLHRRLFLPLVQAIAAIELMLRKWVEPPDINAQDLSTLVQQILSILVQKGGATAAEIYELVRRSFAFCHIGLDVFEKLLRDLGAADMIEQVEGGDLILGLEGERLTEHYEFYAAFTTPDEYEVTYAGMVIGTVQSMQLPFSVGQHLLLGGKRWAIVSVEERRKMLVVEPSQKKQVTRWCGSGGLVHSELRRTMLDLLTSDYIPPWLEKTSREVLSWARAVAREMQLADIVYVQDNCPYLFTWMGSKGNRALQFFFSANGFETSSEFEAGLMFPGMAPTKEKTMELLSSLASNGFEAVEELLRVFGEDVPAPGKFDQSLSPYLRATAFTEDQFDIGEARGFSQRVTEASPVPDE